MTAAKLENLPQKTKEKFVDLLFGGNPLEKLKDCFDLLEVAYMAAANSKEGMSTDSVYLLSDLADCYYELAAQDQKNDKT